MHVCRIPYNLFSNDSLHNFLLCSFFLKSSNIRCKSDNFISKKRWKIPFKAILGNLEWKKKKSVLQLFSKGKFMNHFWKVKSNPEQKITVRPIKTVHYGFNSLTYLGPIIQELLLNNLKRLESVEAFKPKIKDWIPENCPCKICKPYIYQKSFI